MKKRKDGFLGERSIVLPSEVVDMEAKDPLASSLYVTDIGYYPAAQYHYRERTEPIPQHVLIYCVSGCGWFQVGSERHQVSANQYFILPAGKPHTYSADETRPWTIYWLHFNGEHARIYAQGAQQPQTVSPSIHSRISQRNNIFEEIFTTLSHDHSMESLRYVSSLLHYYLASMRYLQQYREAVGQAGLPQQTDEDTIVPATIHYLEESIGQHLTLNEMAAFAGYSVSHFSSIFRLKTGQSPISYFNRMKIDRAAELLATTDIRINQLCFKVGIDDPYYFSRLFTRLKGVSPQTYRTQHAG